MKVFVNIWMVLVGTITQHVSSCPNGWLTHANKCYHFSHDTETWIGALQFCKTFQGTLVEIEDADENNYLKNQAKLTKYDFWIGLSDVQEEGTWSWINSGTRLTHEDFSDWIPGQPDNYQEDENCACLYLFSQHQWNDRPCHDTLHYICEKSDESAGIVG